MATDRNAELTEQRDAAEFNINKLPAAARRRIAKFESDVGYWKGKAQAGPADLRLTSSQLSKQAKQVAKRQAATLRAWEDERLRKSRLDVALSVIGDLAVIPFEQARAAVAAVNTCAESHAYCGYLPATISRKQVLAALYSSEPNWDWAPPATITRVAAAKKLGATATEMKALLAQRGVETAKFAHSLLDNLLTAKTVAPDAWPACITDAIQWVEDARCAAEDLKAIKAAAKEAAVAVKVQLRADYDAANLARVKLGLFEHNARPQNVMVYEIAPILGLSRDQVRTLIAQGQIPASRQGIHGPRNRANAWMINVHWFTEAISQPQTWLPDNSNLSVGQEEREAKNMAASVERKRLAAEAAAGVKERVRVRNAAKADIFEAAHRS